MITNKKKISTEAGCGMEISWQKHNHKTCRQCSGIIDTVTEPCYTIRYENSSYKRKLDVNRAYYFHVGCFQEIAGKKFIEETRPYNHKHKQIILE